MERERADLCRLCQAQDRPRRAGELRRRAGKAQPHGAPPGPAVRRGDRRALVDDGWRTPARFAEQGRGESALRLPHGGEAGGEACGDGGGVRSPKIHVNAVESEPCQHGVDNRFGQARCVGLRNGSPVGEVCHAAIGAADD